MDGSIAPALVDRARLPVSGAAVVCAWPVPLSGERLLPPPSCARCCLCADCPCPFPPARLHLHSLAAVRVLLHGLLLTATDTSPPSCPQCGLCLRASAWRRTARRRTWAWRTTVRPLCAVVCCVVCCAVLLQPCCSCAVSACRGPHLEDTLRSLLGHHIHTCLAAAIPRPCRHDRCIP